MSVIVEKINFMFPADWVANKYDDSIFYRRQFSKMWQQIKAVDIIAVSAEKTAYLIEVKDYRGAVDAGPSELPRLVAQKVFDTLAAQIPCKINGTDPGEQEISTRVCMSKQLVVVLHLEQPLRPMGIFRPYNPANLQLKLRQLLRPIHAHPWVLQKSSMGKAGWDVVF